MFSRILIANRGEVALRIIRACREMGIETVAVHSEADRGALYHRLADESICIGAASPADSYLNISSIMSAAEIADVEAIHPGYGFLAESPHFAEICRSCKIEFIGPSAETMKLLGDKVAARRLAKKVNVPVFPGSEEPISNDDEAVQLAEQVGYPVGIKAAAGGGGRGIRVAHNRVSLVNLLSVARAESEAAFGDSSLYIEKWVENARHVEVQILADQHGHVVHLGERDCTLQRRQQKLLEESPCSSIDDGTRRKLCDAAIRVAQAANYSNVGTVEFIVDERDNFYFIEVNCRIQVEHPVTEMVTGVDLVQQQIRVAFGEKLGLSQRDIRPSGVAIECRINAEDPENLFKPSPGRITHYFPPGGPGVRVDSHIYAGYHVPPHYDSMIAKVIVHRRNRVEAISCMRRALSECVIDGIKTTIPLFLSVFGHSAFLSGRIDTGFIEDTYT